MDYFLETGSVRNFSTPASVFLSFETYPTKRFAVSCIGECKVLRVDCEKLISNGKLYDRNISIRWIHIASLTVIESRTRNSRIDLLNCIVID